MANIIKNIVRDQMGKVAWNNLKGKGFMCVCSGGMHAAGES